MEVEHYEEGRKRDLEKGGGWGERGKGAGKRGVEREVIPDRYY